MAIQEQNRSFAELFQEVLGNIEQIIRSEFLLAKTEAAGQVRRAGKAATVLAAGALSAIFALGLALTAAVLGLATALTAWLSALLIGVVMGIAGMAMLSVGIKRIKQVNPAPERTMDNVRENIQWLKHRTK